MRIAVDARPLAHPHTGIGRYTIALLRRMFELEPDHHWYLYSDRPLNRLWREHPKTTLRCATADSPIGRLWSSQGRYAWWALKDRVDVFWSPRHHLPFLLPRRIRTVLTIHDLVWVRFPETMMPENLKVERSLMPRSVRRADDIIAVSEFTQRELRDVFDALPPVHVIHESGFVVAAPEEATANLVDAGHPYFLFVGTLEPRKNLLPLLRAMSELVQQRSLSVRLVIVGGKGWGDQNVTSWVRELKLEESVVQLGIVPEDALHTVYREALALVMPSLYEGFGLPAVEAMQSGIPVVAGNRGSLPEVVGDGGVLVDPQSEADIAAAMESLIVDQDHRNELATRANERGSRFSWDEAAKKTLALLEGTYSESPGEDQS